MLSWLNFIKNLHMSKKKKNSSSTPKLDLHGVKHQNVESLVEDYVLQTTPPMRIVTGNSAAMKNIVIAVLKKHDYKFQDGDFFSSGCILILSE